MEDQFVGSMLGLALGDAMGAQHEGGPLGQAAWWLLGIGKGDALRWSDDTQMAMGLAHSLVQKRGLDPDHLARTWADRAEWSRGYGPGAWKLLARIAGGEDWRSANRAIFPDGSFGNGAAMRAGPIGLFCHRNLAELRRVAELASRVTHAHPLGIEGGVLIARATAMALAGPLDLEELREFSTHDEYRSRLCKAKEWARAEPSPREVRERLGSSVLAHESAVTAIYAAHRFGARFQPMMEFVVHLGGDTDTIGAMAGSILGARYGVSALPPELLKRLEALPEIERLGRELFRVAP